MQQQQAERNAVAVKEAVNALGRRGGIPGRELAAALGLDPSAVTRRMEAARSRGKENAEVAKLVPLCSADNPPPPGAATYVCSITVTAQGNPAGGSYSWSTTSNAVTLSNSTSQTVTVIGSSESSSQGDVAIVVTYTVNQQPNTAQIQTTVQKPTSMGFVGVNYDRRITDPRCHDTGWEKEIKWQVQDRWGSPMKFAMGTWDTLTNSPNNCFLPTQGEGTLPTAGLATASDGSWVHDYALCSSACNTGNCQVTGTQSYTVNGYQINLSYKMTCNSITVSGH